MHKYFLAISILLISLPTFSSIRKLQIKKPIKSVLYNGEIFNNTFMNQTITSQNQLNEIQTHEKNTLQNFSSDGCSSFPDGTFYNPKQWQHCCVAHDVKYWAGGSSKERLMADQELKQCVAEASNVVLAEMMYQGVRVGGMPSLKTTWRWGYGWTQLRGYRTLTSMEKQDLQIKTLEFGKPLIKADITAPIINYFKLPSKNNNYCIDEAIHNFKEKYGAHIQIDSIKYKRSQLGQLRTNISRNKKRTTVVIKSSLCRDEIVFNFGKLKRSACIKAIFQEASPKRLKSINAKGDCRVL